MWWGWCEGCEGRSVGRGAACIGLVSFGSWYVVFLKCSFTIQVKGDDDLLHRFEKPWFQTDVMFLSLCIGFILSYAASNLGQRFNSRAKRKHMHYAPTTQQAVQLQSSWMRDSRRLEVFGVGNQTPEMKSMWKKLLLYLIPSMCDLVSTILCFYALLWISASLWQMLKCSMLVIGALFSKFFLKTPMLVFRWIGVAFVVLGLIVICCSSLILSCESNVSLAEEGIGVAFVIIAQCIQAAQLVITPAHTLELLTSNPLLIFALEGLYGFVACTFLLVIIYFIPEPYGEDTIETFHMLADNPTLIVTIFVYALCVFFYYFAGVFVVTLTSSRVRVVLDTLIAGVVWLGDLLIHYVLVPQSPEFGERWTEWSFLQLCGFTLLVLGIFVYQGMIQISGLDYPEHTDTQSRLLENQSHTYSPVPSASKRTPKST
ncbi:solute carrier family 35 member F6 [Pelomyxa schiedti]|nr:solute carrier family 35 member F6 [Pelomyxa schiedti]